MTKIYARTFAVVPDDVERDRVRRPRCCATRRVERPFARSPRVRAAPGARPAPRGAAARPPRAPRDSGAPQVRGYCRRAAPCALISAAPRQERARLAAGAERAAKNQPIQGAARQARLRAELLPHHQQLAQRLRYGAVGETYTSPSTSTAEMTDGAHLVRRELMTFCRCWCWCCFAPRRRSSPPTWSILPAFASRRG